MGDGLDLAILAPTHDAIASWAEIDHEIMEAIDIVWVDTLELVSRSHMSFSAAQADAGAMGQHLHAPAQSEDRPAVSGSEVKQLELRSVSLRMLAEVVSSRQEQGLGSDEAHPCCERPTVA